jgi:hypothetical protein
LKQVNRNGLAMKKTCICLLLSVFPLQGVTAVHTNAHHGFEVMDHLLPLGALNQGDMNNANDFFSDTVCNGQLLSPPIVADVDIFLERHDSTSDPGWNGASHFQILPEELAENHALQRMDGIKNIGEEMASRLAISATFMLPTIPAFTFDTSVINAACVARLVH